jgi:hypothetical protein
MQQGYQYVLTEPMGRNFDPDFTPYLTPKEMLALGVFGGKYMTDCQAEFPKTWFTHAKLSPSGYSVKLNFFCTKVSHFVCGNKRVGLIRCMIHADGFSGIVATTWVGGFRQKTGVRLGAGTRLRVTRFS